MIPVRIDSQDRIDNLNIILDYISHHFDTNIFVCEESKIKSVNIPNELNNVKYEWDFSENELFHRTKILNKMTLKSNTDIVVNYDTDVLFEVGAYEIAANTIRSGIDVVYPYNGSFMEISRRNIPYIKEYKKIPPNCEKICIHPSSVGGAIFFNRKRYIEAGMENPNFISYGYEDNERYSRFLKLGYSIKRINCELIHLEHYRGINSNMSNSKINDNLKEYQKVSLMSTGNLKEYIKTWKNNYE